MGHSVANAVLASKLNQAMGIYLNPLNSRGQRRAWESNVISSYNSMINNLSSMMSSVGFGTISEADRFNDPVGKKKTHDALAGALGGFENTTVSQLQADISHDMNELIRLETIKGGENVYDPLTQWDDLIEGGIISELTDKISQKTNYLNSYNGAGVFLDIFGLVDKQKKILELRKSIEMEKNRILLEDETSEEYEVSQLNEMANIGIDQYNIYKSERAESELQYTEWLAEQQALKEQNEKERLENIVTTEDITIPTTEPTVIPHNDEETEYIEETDKVNEPIPVKNKIGAGILALGAIGVLLALRYR